MRWESNEARTSHPTLASIPQQPRKPNYGRDGRVVLKAAKAGEDRVPVMLGQIRIANSD